MTKFLFSAFLAIHGMIHGAYFAPVPNDPNYPFDPNKSWLVTKMGLSLGTVKPIFLILAIIAFIGFIAAGLSYLGWILPTDWFKAITLISSVVSLSLIIATWNNWFVVGALIDIFLIWWVLKK